VHKPKGVETNGRGCVYIHGSGFMVYSAELTQGEACEFACATKTTVFNIDYRKIPSFTALDIQKDVWAGL